MNTPVEFDVYAHANSTLVDGTRQINGLGGSVDYLEMATKDCIPVALAMSHSSSIAPSRCS